MLKLFLLIILLVLLRFYISCNSSENFIENLDEDKNKSDEDSHENNLLHQINNIKANCLMKPDLDDKTISLIKGPKGDMGGKSMAYFPLVNGSSSNKYFSYQPVGPADYQNIIQNHKKPKLFDSNYMWAFTDDGKFKCQGFSDYDFNKNDNNEIILKKNGKNLLTFTRRPDNSYKNNENLKLCLTNNDNKMILKDCILSDAEASKNNNTDPKVSTQQWYFQF